MTEEIKMPQLGESVTEGTITKWLVKPGDKVNKYDPIAEVMTDKVNAEVPCSAAGTIKELMVKEDETVQVGSLICYIETEADTQKRKIDKDDAPKTEPTDSSEIASPEENTAAESLKHRYSPAVLRMAQDNNIDLTAVTGSGRGGRITRKDLESIINNEVSSAGSSAEPGDTDNEKHPHISSNAGDAKVPLSGVRKAIASKMQQSSQEIPHAWTMVEVDVTNLVAYRNQIKQEFKRREGFPITFFPFFIKAVVESLQEFPEINSVWGGDHILQKKDINVSIAVSADNALYVPVIPHADEKSIKGIAKEVNRLAEKARNGKLSGEDMKKGTFTINNTGSFGSVQSVPIINYPQAAILSVESIVKKPVVMQGDMLAVRSMVNLCLSLDHRVLDGLICGRFLARIKEKLENFDQFKDSVY
ncbi:dihydrolipoamide acetyltransferase family protein [Alteribacillus sp. HJP-4]|uniref:dihydrolipoamide acetyltransferase family protein n=1 Tax=Alteribacillus sp. HJP-4 TaxID=2775394 RepID=UPI0035CD36DC